MRVDPITNETMYGYVAPDGSIQLGTIAPDLPMCLAMAKLHHKKGIAMSAFELDRKGFKIQRLRVTINAHERPEPTLPTEKNN